MATVFSRIDARYSRLSTTVLRTLGFTGLALLVLYPLTRAAFRAVFDSTVRPDPSLLFAPATLRVLLTTAWVVGASCILAATCGALLAWVQERTDADLGRWADLLPLVPLFISPLLGATGMVVLFHPRVGFINAALRSVLGSAGFPIPDWGPLNVHSAGGLIAVMAVYLVPYAYLTASAALRRLDPALEEASRTSGAGLVRTWWRVTLPSVAPALGAALVLCFVMGVGLFSVPVVIGLPARIQVLSVYVFQLLEYYPPRMGDALLLSAVLLAAVQSLLLLQRRLVPPGRHATVTGGFLRRRIPLGRWRPWVRAVTLVYLLAAFAAPLAALLLVSLQRFWTPAISWPDLGPSHYLELLRSGPPGRALLNSLTLAVLTATASLLLVGGLVLLENAQPSRPRTAFLDLLTTIPATLPHLTLGVALLLAFSTPPLDLRGTPLLLFLCYLILSLPFAARAAATASASVGVSLLEASRVFRAGSLLTLWRVLFPLARPFLLAGWVVVFVHSAAEVTASSILAGSSTPVIGRVMLDLQGYGSYPQLAAMGVTLAAVNAAAVACVLRLGRSGLDALAR